MAEIQWIKITTDIWDDEKIRVIEKMPEGDTMLIIWLKLLVLAGKKNDSGFVYLTDTIPYTPDILSDIFNRESRLISLALNTFASFGMIEIENNVINVLNWDRHQNVEGMDKIRKQNRIRQQKFRQKRMLLEDSNVISRDSNGTDKNREELDKIEIKDNKEKINKKENYQPFSEYKPEKQKSHTEKTRERIQEIKQHWKTLSVLPQSKALDTNQNHSTNLLDVFTVFPNEDIIQAMNHLSESYLSTDPKYRIKSFSNFMTVENVEKWYPEQSVDSAENKRELTPEELEEVSKIWD